MCVCLCVCVCVREREMKTNGRQIKHVFIVTDRDAMNSLLEQHRSKQSKLTTQNFQRKVVRIETKKLEVFIACVAEKKQCSFSLLSLLCLQKHDIL